MGTPITRSLVALAAAVTLATGVGVGTAAADDAPPDISSTAEARHEGSVTLYGEIDLNGEFETEALFGFHYEYLHHEDLVYAELWALIDDTPVPLCAGVVVEDDWGSPVFIGQVPDQPDSICFAHELVNGAFLFQSVDEIGEYTIAWMVGVA